MESISVQIWLSGFKPQWKVTCVNVMRSFLFYFKLNIDYQKALTAKNICHSRVRMFFNVIIPNILNSQMSFWSFISNYKYIISEISMTINRTYRVISLAIFSWLLHYILTYHISKLMPEIRCWFDYIYRNWKK